jgi:hypothetical protein
MTTITLTPELGEAVEQAVERSGGQPIRVEDPRSRRTYLLFEEAAYETRTSADEACQPPLLDLPEGVRRSQAAFLRDLPELVKDESLRGQWVIYHGDERIGIAPSDEPLIRECSRRGLKSDQYDLFVIEETEQVDYPSAWMV